MIPSDTPFEFTEGIARLFMTLKAPSTIGQGPEADPTTTILVMEDAESIVPDLRELLVRHRTQAKDDSGGTSMFRVGREGRMVVVVMQTLRAPDLREAIFRVSTIRVMQAPKTGAGLLTFVCLDDEWTDATGEAELPIKDRRWPREN